MDNNPLLTRTELPNFSQIKPEHVEPAIEQLLKTNQEKVQQILSQKTMSWDSLILPLQEIDNQLAEAWSPVRHLNSVMNNEALRTAHDNCLGKISEYYTELGQNKALYEAYVSLMESDEYQHYNPTQKKLLEYAIRDFKLAGVVLEKEMKQRFKAIQQQLSKLHAQFENNLLDATDAWSINVTDEQEVQGIPEHALLAAKQLADKNQQPGWTFNLEFPSYLAVITYADHRPLREAIYSAFTTRASDQGPHAGQWDNSQLIEDIMRLRHEEALLLGFNNFAELSLEPKMAKNTQQIIDFLAQLADKSKAFAKKDYAQLCDFAKEQFQANEVKPWDIAYYSEKLRQHQYAISKEALRPYFPETRVIPGLFSIINKLYGMTIEPVNTFDSWHSDVKLFEVYDEAKQLRGKLYMDLYARPSKRGGAWMDQCHSRYIKIDHDLNVPVAFLTCNFSAPSHGKPALLSHDEVITLFHEMGHVLHGILTQVDYADLAGTNNVAWDAVELPSQFLENWCWDKQALDLISGHIESGDPIPDELYNKMIAAKNFQSAMQMVRQLEFSLFDFRLHLEYEPGNGSQHQRIIKEVRDELAAYSVPEFNRFQHGFSHIFAGGYAAGYYSYKWAEVLSSDAFSKFEEHGIFDQQTGREFLHCILETGGSVDPAEAFVKFRGREPTIDALLRHSGLS